MKRALALLFLGAAGVAAHADDPCSGKVGAGILAFDRESRQAVGFLLNQCGRPVALDLMVLAINRSGFAVARGHAEVHATDDAPLSAFVVELPFVQSAIELSHYETEVEQTVALGEPLERSATVTAKELSPQRATVTPDEQPDAM
jgi:hypothetical protein